MAKTEASTASPEYLRAWRMTIIIALIGAFLFIRPFLAVIALGALMAYLFNPVYKWLLKKIKRPGIAVTLTTLFATLVVGVPILIIFAVAIYQAVSLINDLNIGGLEFTGDTANSAVASVVEDVNRIASDLVGASQVVSIDQVNSFLQTTLPNALKTVGNILLGFVSGFPALFTSLILFFFIFIGFLVNQVKIIENLRYLSPFEDKVNDLYFKRIGAMASAMVKGQFLIAFAQGLVSALAMLLLGLNEFFIFFVLLFTFLSLIPLGAGMITIPIGIIAILFGDVWQGALILLNHFVIVTNIDNFRPKLVPKEARLPAALTILSAFAGVAYFGLLGVIYGPIIMIVITTTIETYVEMRKKQSKTSTT